MNTPLSFFLPFFLLLCSMFATSLGGSTRAAWEALMAFKSSTSNHPNLEGWKNGSNPCMQPWYGITCRKNHITSLVLEDLQLEGQIHSLTPLKYLRVLSLKGNYFNGTLPDMSTWKYLKFLYLSSNLLSGSIPDSLSSSSPRLVRVDLSNNQFVGKIPPSLNSLHQLLTLNLRGNNLDGPIPTMNLIANLQELYLADNRLSGSIPDSVSALSSLVWLDLSNNKLGGAIPPSLNSLHQLISLKLGGNNLSGPLPAINLTNLQEFNVSGNSLAGPIPAPLSRFPISSFRGNLNLCGVPLLVCGDPQTSSGDMIISSPIVRGPPLIAHNVGSTPRRFGFESIAAIVIGNLALLLIITCFAIVCCRRRIARQLNSGEATDRKSAYSPGQYSPGPHPSQKEDMDRGNLTFTDGKKLFELEDLLRASAEMLGRGTLGTAYKAVLADGCIVAVKRLKDASAPWRRKEFEEHMELLGQLHHPNLAHLRAFFYAKAEKLLVYDYFPNGSLFSLLHGNRGPGRTPLDWTTRVKIALGTARGLVYIHAQKVFPLHGNVKSANVLIDKNGNACISDYSLASSPGFAKLLVGYKGDVYNFGLLLLEMLTGKAIGPHGCLDLPKWVQSVVREEWTSEVFDLELLKYKNIEEEMVAMLQIAMSCTSESPDSRPNMRQVFRRIEEIRGGGDQSPQYSLDSVSQSPSITEDIVPHSPKL